MAFSTDLRPIGVEVELPLLDIKTLRPTPKFSLISERISRLDIETVTKMLEPIRTACPGFHLPSSAVLDLLHKDRVCKEYDQGTVEIKTSPSDDIGVHAQELVALLGIVFYTSLAEGVVPLLSGCYVPKYRKLSRNDGDRYKAIEQKFGALIERDTACGLHIHVEAPEERMELVHGLQQFMPSLLALSSNSSFEKGQYKKMSSYRSAALLNPYPFSGFMHPEMNEKVYNDIVERIVSGGLVPDSHCFYWRMRPHESYPTVECKALDTPGSLESILGLAAFYQGIATKLALIIADGKWADHPMNVWSPARSREEIARADLLFQANWWSAMDEGLGGQMFDIASDNLDPIPAVELATRQLAFAEGEAASPYLQRVKGMLADPLGTGADRQSAVFKKLGGIKSVLGYQILQSWSGIVPQEDLYKLLQEAKVSKRRIDSLMDFVTPFAGV